MKLTCNATADTKRHKKTPAPKVTPTIYHHRSLTWSSLNQVENCLKIRCTWVKIRALFQLFELLEICNVQSSFCDTPQLIAVFLKAQMTGLTTHELKPGDMINII